MSKSVVGETLISGHSVNGSDSMHEKSLTAWECVNWITTAGVGRMLLCNSQRDLGYAGTVRKKILETAP